MHEPLRHHDVHERRFHRHLRVRPRASVVKPNALLHVRPKRPHVAQWISTGVGVASPVGRDHGEDRLGPRRCEMMLLDVVDEGFVEERVQLEQRLRGLHVQQVEGPDGPDHFVEENTPNCVGVAPRPHFDVFRVGKTDERVGCAPNEACIDVSGIQEAIPYALRRQSTCPQPPLADGVVQGNGKRCKHGADRHGAVKRDLLVVVPRNGVPRDVLVRPKGHFRLD
ncbi:hypothetical protein H310_08688 [Aphanomyces invadans]|uniref:Uncharacterized protein n=1 Tax=Aphanomyces invadans TaxID=157072 RepID=A0A024TX53_9STRA|nr:hypothetical protein H310_08688 [Aphanomyces invadans]ETV98564.1 hypothetical protein H310_08688 [Aphanomyces invadans]|eukprot:XP_008872761.1 hypothetical protein H310_08688 [Aphanomyces invadans]